MANTSAGNSIYAMLLDTGNLILTNRALEVLWQSFDYPTHTLLPGMKLGKHVVIGHVWSFLAKKKGHVWSLTSWKSLKDPAPGRFSLQLHSLTTQLVSQLTIMEGVYGILD